MANIGAAIDLGDSKSVTTVLSPGGDVADSFSFTMNDEGYSSFAQRVPTNARVAFEATGMAYSVFRALKRLGYEDITVAHPKDLVWIVKSKKKNDRVDSLKIAKLHMAGILSGSVLLNHPFPSYGFRLKGPISFTLRTTGGLLLLRVKRSIRRFFL